MEVGPPKAKQISLLAGKYAVWQATGGLLSAGYKNWQLGMPDNTDNNENCVHIGRNNQPGWNDYDCFSSYFGSMPLGGICELQPWKQHKQNKTKRNLILNSKTH